MRRSSRAPHLLLVAGGATVVFGVLLARRASAASRPGVLEDAYQPRGPLDGVTPAETTFPAPPQPMPVTEPGTGTQPGPDPDSRDLEAAARMIASENPHGSRQLHIEQIWTQIRARKHGQSLFDRITAGSGWGAQGAKQAPGRTRPVATGQAASPAQLDLAEKVLRGQERSRLEGARKFFEPAQQDKAFAVAEQARAQRARGEALTDRETRLLGYRHTAAEIRADWGKDSRYLDTLDGVEFWT